jgi:glycerol-3-phosphate cytidylyltransferase
MKIGFTCGVFDLFHAGHVLMLQDCKNQCDYLIVAINSGQNIDENINKGKNKPIFSLEDRVMIIKSCKFVDMVITYSNEEELSELIDLNNINIRFLGDDYFGKPITKSKQNIIIKYINRGHGKSTSGFIKEIVKKYKNV